MFLLADALRVGVVTGHVPLKDIAGSVTKEKLSAKLKDLDLEIEQVSREFDKYQNYASRKAIEQEYDRAFEKASVIAKKFDYPFLIDHTHTRGNREAQKTGFKIRIRTIDREQLSSISLRAFLQVRNSEGGKTVVGDTVQVKIDVASSKDKTDFWWDNLWPYHREASVEVYEASVAFKDGRERLITDLSCYWVWRHSYDLDCK